MGWQWHQLDHMQVRNIYSRYQKSKYSTNHRIIKWNGYLVKTSALRTQPMMLPRCGTLLTYGNALVTRRLRSPATGNLQTASYDIQYTAAGPSSSSTKHYYYTTPFNGRVSTNLTEQISRRFQEGFQEKCRTCLHCFGLLCNVLNLLHSMEHVMMSSNQRSIQPTTRSATFLILCCSMYNDTSSLLKPLPVSKQ